MEVHHPHGHHGPKKGKEYVLEFIMLFAAVSLGFLAENIREGFIERHRSHELALALRTDIKQDVEKIKILNVSRTDILRKAKLAVFDIEKNGFKRSDTNQYRLMLRSAYYWQYFEPTTANLDQIINSGSLRYFKNRELVEAISTYRNFINIIESRNEREKQFFYDVMQPIVLDHLNLSPMDTTHFNGDMINKDFFNKIDSGMINIKTKDLVLFDNDPMTKFKVLNAYRSFSINVTNTMRTYIRPYVIEAEHLIELLNKELEE